MFIWSSVQGAPKDGLQNHRAAASGPPTFVKLWFLLHCSFHSCTGWKVDSGCDTSNLCVCSFEWTFPESSPDSWRSLNTLHVVLLAMAALPSISSFLAAFPAVIWSLDWTRTSPGWSTSSKICFVFPSFSFWPRFNSESVHMKTWRPDLKQTMHFLFSHYSVNLYLYGTLGGGHCVVRCWIVLEETTHAPQS